MISAIKLNLKNNMILKLLSSYSNYDYADISIQINFSEKVIKSKIVWLKVFNNIQDTKLR